MFAALWNQKNQEKSLTEKTPLIGKQQQRQSNRRFFLPTRCSSPHSVSFEMADAVTAATLRSVYLGVDVGTGSARAGLSFAILNVVFRICFQWLPYFCVFDVINLFFVLEFEFFTVLLLFH